MRAETKDNLVLAAKSIVLLLGAIVTMAALVELIVGGVSALALAYLLVGLLLAVPPLALAFRDAVAAGRRGADASDEEAASSARDARSQRRDP